jgi:hypothetical protein
MSQSCFVLSFWTYASDGDQIVEFINGWDRSGGGGDLVAEIYLRRTDTRLRAWKPDAGSDAGTTGTPLSLGEYHLVTLVAAGDREVQGVYESPVFNQVVLGQPASPTTVPFGGDTLIVGDTSSNAPDNGNYYYDDFSLDHSPCPRDSDVDLLSDGAEMLDHGTNPLIPDSDNDGCVDGEETPLDSGTEMFGGRRDPLHFWDFFDTPDTSNVRDKAVAGTDFFRILSRFGATGSTGIDPLSAPPPPPAYHTAFDRGLSSGPNAWSLMAADGSVAGTDFFSILAQFGHSCAAPP